MVGIKDQLLIDNMFLRNCKGRQTGLRMALIDYKKVPDMILHSWLKKYMRRFRVAKNMQMVLINSMEKCKRELTFGR